MILLRVKASFSLKKLIFFVLKTLNPSMKNFKVF